MRRAWVPFAGLEWSITMSHTRDSITGREARDWEIATQDPGNGELRMEDVKCLRTRQVDAGPVRYVEI